MKKAGFISSFLLASLFFAQFLGGEDGFVRVAGEKGFTLNGKPWHPLGCNYHDPLTGWAPKLWRQFDPERVERHFDVMEKLGVNVVRVFLTAESFIPSPPDLETEALEKFDAMLAIARRRGIRVHPTGPDHWEGTPPWRRGDIFTSERALEAQVAFWKAFSRRYRNEPAIFAYDLLNEPHIRWRNPTMEAAWRVWLKKKYPTLEALRQAWGSMVKELKSLEDVEIPPDQPAENAESSRRLLDFQRFRESLADRWVRLQTEAIRAEDSNHPVTVGFIQWSVPVRHGRPSRYAAFRPSRIASLVDFLSVHFYPLWGDPLASEENFHQNLAYLELVLRYVRAGDPQKPLLVGEFGWYGGGQPNGQVERSPQDQTRWCRAAVLQGKGIAAGWLNWSFADTPSSRDISKFSGLVTEKEVPKPWGEVFRQFAGNPDSWSVLNGEPERQEVFESERAILDPEDGNEMLRRYFSAWKEKKGCRLLVR